MNRSLALLLPGALLGAFAPASTAQVATALAREAEQLPGAAVGQITTAFNNTAVNQVGGWSVAANTSGPAGTLSHIWGAPTGGAPTVMLTEMLNVAGYDQTAFESFYGMDDLGRSFVGPTCNVTGGGATGLDCVWLDLLPVAVEEQPIPTLPGKKYRFNSRPGITGNGTPYWAGGINDIATNANEGNGLFRGLGAICVLKTGDPAPAPLTSNYGASAADFDVRFSRNASNFILAPQTTDPTTSDYHLNINGSIALDAGGNLMIEGSPVSAAAGAVGAENWQNWGMLGINEAGTWFCTGDTSGPTTSDGFIVKNGVILWREGQTVSGLTLVGSPSNGAYMNEAGQVAFIWDTTGSIEALFLDGVLLLKEGDLVDWDGDGLVDANAVLTDFTGISSLTIGEDGSLYFTADVNVGGTVLEGIFRIRTGTPPQTFCSGDGSGTACPCGNSGAAGNGCANSVNAAGGRIAASGTSSISADTLLLSGNGMPSSSALYFQGTTRTSGGAGAVFGDGLRCAGGAIVRLKTLVNSGGASQYPQVGDPSVSVRGLVGAPGTRTYQIWYRNAAAFCTAQTFNLTNGVEVTWSL